MSRRFAQFVMQVRRNGIGTRFTRVSVRLAVIVDLAYIGLGALGGAVAARSAADPAAIHAPPASACIDLRARA
jgi:hypothetical protein